MSNVISLTGVDLAELTRHAYDLSAPQGLGFLHYQSAPMTIEQARTLVERQQPRNSVGRAVILDHDYIAGRAVKLTVFRGADGSVYMHAPWYDHTDEQLAELLRRVGVAVPAPENPKHAIACNCAQCRQFGRPAR